MVTDPASIDSEFLKTAFTATATLAVGILVSIISAVTLIFTVRNNKRNYGLLFEKDRWEKQKSYNRVLGSFLKVYHSYIKHKFLFEEQGNENIPDRILPNIAAKIDRLMADVKLFRETVDRETEILPELTITLHSFLDILERYEIMMEEIPKDFDIEGVENLSLVVQRAHMFATKEMLDEEFFSIIEKLAEKAEVSDTFLADAKEFDSEESLNNRKELQNELLDRFVESISRQTGQNLTKSDLLN